MSEKNFRPSDACVEGAAHLRCHCGSLLARMTPRGLELKCRRCKRIVVVDADATRRTWIQLPLHQGGP